jgi:hypothetical protein
MEDEKKPQSQTRTIVFVDAVNFTEEMNRYGREKIAPKINWLQEAIEFFFVFKLRGEIIGKLGDGFLLLCPPMPAEVIGAALSLRSFIETYNVGKQAPHSLKTRIAIRPGRSCSLLRAQNSPSK